jgi:hypothetical protein
MEPTNVRCMQSTAGLVGFAHVVQHSHVARGVRLCLRVRLNDFPLASRTRAVTSFRLQVSSLQCSRHSDSLEGRAEKLILFEQGDLYSRNCLDHFLTGHPTTDRLKLQKNILLALGMDSAGTPA